MLYILLKVQQKQFESYSVKTQTTAIYETQKQASIFEGKYDAFRIKRQNYHDLLM